MRRPVIAGNWKMHKTRAETRVFFQRFLPLVADAEHCDILIAPPFTALSTAVEATRGTRVSIAAQDLHWESEGAFTGEISAGMLVEVGCRAVIVGHSERRLLFGESNEQVARKTLAALAAGLVPIVCLGETLPQREQGCAEQVLQRQFEQSLGALTAEQFSRIMIAYEPVWAIGTGRTATPAMAAAMHRFVRRLVAQQGGETVAEQMRILYGGSVRPDNIVALMNEPEIDGVLVGGASLEAESFAAIVQYPGRGR